MNRLLWYDGCKKTMMVFSVIKLNDYNYHLLSSSLSCVMASGIINNQWWTWWPAAVWTVDSRMGQIPDFNNLGFYLISYQLFCLLQKLQMKYVVVTVKYLYWSWEMNPTIALSNDWTLDMSKSVFTVYTIGCYTTTMMLHHHYCHDDWTHTTSVFLSWLQEYKTNQNNDGGQTWANVNNVYGWYLSATT